MYFGRIALLLVEFLRGFRKSCIWYDSGTTSESESCFCRATASEPFHTIFSQLGVPKPLNLNFHWGGGGGPARKKVRNTSLVEHLHSVLLKYTTSFRLMSVR